MCATCDEASFVATADWQHLYALMSGTTRQLRHGGRERVGRVFRWISAGSTPSRSRTSGQRGRGSVASTAAAVVFFAAAVGSLGYTASQADAVVWPAVERQQESVKTFLATARDYAKQWEEQSQADVAVSRPEPESPIQRNDNLERILPEVVTDQVGPHQFMTVGETNQPLRFDPCRPVFWTLNSDNEPAGTRDLLNDAFETMSMYTGLSFQFVGETTEGWAPQRDIRNDGYDGVGEWKPVGVWWMTEPQIVAARTLMYPEENNEGIAGFAGPVGMGYGPTDTRFVSVSGQIVMNATYSRQALASGLVRDLTWVLWHEIGHLVGLDHSEEGIQLMNAMGTAGEFELSPGDIQGLALAGAGPCLGDSYPTSENYRPYYTQPSVVYVDDIHAH